MKKITSVLLVSLLLSLNAQASIELSVDCAEGIKKNIEFVQKQASGIISNSKSLGRVKHAAYLLYISSKYVIGTETMQDSELSDTASICEAQFDVTKLVELSSF